MGLSHRPGPSLAFCAFLPERGLAPRRNAGCGYRHVQPVVMIAMAVQAAEGTSLPPVQVSACM